MEFKEKVDELINQFLEIRKDLFVIENKISIDNQINIIIDGDNEVSIQDCLDFSRAIENNLDREIEDYSLSVSSAGVGNPILNNRQYKKNIGRNFKIITDNKEYNGKLTSVNEEDIEIEWVERVPKEIGKGKENKIFNDKIKYKVIKKAYEEINF